MEKRGFPAHRVLLAGATAVAVFCAAGSASAATPGFYIAGKLGRSTADMDASSPLQLNVLMGRPWSDSYDILMWSETELDKKGQGFEIAVGYQFSSHLAVEGAYIDLGDITFDVPLTVSTDGTDSYDARTTVSVGRRGPALSLVGIWPATRAISLDARAGAFFGQSAAKVTFGLEGETPSQAKYTDRETSAFFGAGVSWSIWPKAAIRLGYTHFSKDALVHHEVGRISLGVKVSF